jgi:hypothetical protein
MKAVCAQLVCDQTSVSLAVPSCFGCQTDGGGTVPDWVPADAKIHIDLVGGTPQARAWVEGTGEVAVNTLLGSDPNTETGWGPTIYNPSYLTANGYVDQTAVNSIVAISGLRSGILAGATIVLREKVLGVPFDNNFVLLSADGSAAIQYNGNMGTGGGELYSWASDIDVEIPNILNVGPGDINVIAITNTPTRAEYAINGSAPASAVLTTTDFPVSGPSEIIAVVIDIGSDSLCAFQSITIYDPLPTTAGLPGLSLP